MGGQLASRFSLGKPVLIWSLSCVLAAPWPSLARCEYHRIQTGGSDQKPDRPCIDSGASLDQNLDTGTAMCQSGQVANWQL